MLQESPNEQFHQGTLQGETPGDNQQLPSHSLTQKLPMDGPSLSSSSFKLPCKNPKCRRMTHFPGFSPPLPISSSIPHPVCTTVVPAKGFAESFFHLMAGTSKEQVPCCPMIWAITPKTSRSFVQLLCMVSPTKANTRTTSQK